MTPLLQYKIADNIVAFSTERGTVNVNDRYSQFNVNEWTGDHPTHVTQCRAELCHYLGISPDRLLLPHQVHGTRVVEVNTNTWSRMAELLEGADALITDMAGICIGVNTADCVPLLFFDPEHNAVAAVHAGWRGTVNRIAVITLARMYESFGTMPANIRCWMGPSIGPDAFEVGYEVTEAFAKAGFPMADIAIRLPGIDDPTDMRWHINLWTANSWQLQRAGVPAANIRVTAICSHTQHDRFFSARRLGITSGRTLTGIMIRQKAERRTINNEE